MPKRIKTNKNKLATTDMTRLPLSGMTKLSNPCRLWCEQTIEISREYLQGEIKLFYWPFRHQYQESILGTKYEHIELEIEGQNNVILNVVFVALGLTKYEPFVKSAHGYSSVCVLPDLAEAIHVIGVLQDHLQAQIRVLGYADDLNPVRVEPVVSI